MHLTLLYIYHINFILNQTFILRHLFITGVHGDHRQTPPRDSAAAIDPELGGDTSSGDGLDMSIRCRLYLRPSFVVRTSRSAGLHLGGTSGGPRLPWEREAKGDRKYILFQMSGH